MAWDQENLGSNPRSPTSFCGVAKWQGDWLLTSLCAGSNPAPTAKNAGVAFWSRAPLLQRGAVEFDPLPRYQMTARLWPRGFRHRSSKAIHAGSSPARRSMPRSFNGRTKVFGAFYVGSIPALGERGQWGAKQSQIEIRGTLTASSPLRDHPIVTLDEPG